MVLMLAEANVYIDEPDLDPIPSLSSQQAKESPGEVKEAGRGKSVGGGSTRSYLERTEECR